MKGTVTGHQELHSSVLSARGREVVVKFRALGHRKLESPIRKPMIGCGTDGKESLSQSKYPFASKYYN